MVGSWMVGKTWKSGDHDSTQLAVGPAGSKTCPTAGRASPQPRITPEITVPTRKSDVSPLTLTIEPELGPDLESSLFFEVGSRSTGPGSLQPVPHVPAPNQASKGRSFNGFHVRPPLLTHVPGWVMGQGRAGRAMRKPHVSFFLDQGLPPAR